MNTINETFRILADRAAEALQPADRANTVANTLREWGGLAAHYCPPGATYNRLTERDLRAALEALGAAHHDDDAPRSAQRAICRELAALLAVGDQRVAAPRAALIAWEALTEQLAEDLADAPAIDIAPRLSAILATARREHAGLRALPSPLVALTRALDRDGDTYTSAVNLLEALADVAPLAPEVRDVDLIGAVRWLAARGSQLGRRLAPLFAYYRPLPGVAPQFPDVEVGVAHLRAAIRSLAERDAEGAAVDPAIAGWCDDLRAFAERVDVIPRAGRVRRIEVTIHPVYERQIAALVAGAAAPFGSLDHCAAELGTAMVAASERSADGARALADLTVIVEHDDRYYDRAGYDADPARVWCLPDAGVQIVTPTSGTEISLRWDQRRDYWVLSVDFGPSGSSSRCATILERWTHALEPGVGLTLGAVRAWTTSAAEEADIHC